MFESLKKKFSRTSEQLEEELKEEAKEEDNLQEESGKRFSFFSFGRKKEEEDTREILTLTGKITKIAQGVVEGNSHYYIMLEGSEEIFDISVVDMIQIIKYEVGQEITVEYKASENVNTVLSIK